MIENLPAISAFTFAEEGGYSTDPNDSGNYLGQMFVGSNLGVTATELAAWMAPTKVNALTMRALTQAQAMPIYAVRYFQAMHCNLLPSGPDAMVCDFGYNAGAGTSAMEFQSLVGVGVDGWIGPATLAAYAATDPASLLTTLTGDAAMALQRALDVLADGQIGPVTKLALAGAGNRFDTRALVVCCALAQAQADHYRRLPQFPLYGNGWLARTGRRLKLAIDLITKGK